MPRKKKSAVLPCKVYGRENRLQQIRAILVEAPELLDDVTVDLAYSVIWYCCSDRLQTSKAAK